MKASRIKIDAHAARFRNLIEGMLEPIPTRRIELQAVAKHPWVCTTCPNQDICRGLLKAMCQRVQSVSDRPRGRGY